jgi:hypothetical protein
MSSSGILHITRAVLRSCTARHASANADTADMWENLAAPRAAASATTGNSEKKSVSVGFQIV